jgi:uncharacterized membrane protein
MKKTFGIWKTTILGGVFFLLPFAVVLFLIGQLAGIIYPVAEQIKPYLPESLNFANVSLATVLATALLLASCYLAGLAARRSFAARFSEKVEKYLLLLFPRYAIVKDQMASNIGGDASRPQLQPVLVTFDDAARIGFEVERADAGPVTVFLPGSPDPWQGHVVHVPAERVARLAADFGQTVGICETLGRQASPVVAGARAQPTTSPHHLAPGQ